MPKVVHRHNQKRKWVLQFFGRFINLKGVWEPCARIMDNMCGAIPVQVNTDCIRIPQMQPHSFLMDDMWRNNNFGTSSISTSSFSSTFFNFSSGMIFLFVFGFCKLLSLMYFQAYFRTNTLDAVSVFKNSFKGLLISQSICNPFGFFSLAFICFPFVSLFSSLSVLK